MRKSSSLLIRLLAKIMAGEAAGRNLSLLSIFCPELASSSTGRDCRRN